MEYIIISAIVIWVGYKFLDRKKHKKFDRDLQEFCLGIMEPVIGKKEEWILAYFKKQTIDLTQKEFDINKSEITCSIYKPLDDGSIMIKFNPYFNEENICEDYDVFFVFHDQKGMTNIDNHLFTSRYALINGEPEQIQLKV